MQEIYDSVIIQDNLLSSGKERSDTAYKERNPAQMGQGHAQVLVPGQVVHVQDQGQSQGSDQSHVRDQGHANDPHLDQSHHSLPNKYVC